MWHALRLDLINEATRNYSRSCELGPKRRGNHRARADPIEQAVFHPSMLERCIGNVIEFFERYGSRIDEVRTRRHHRARRARAITMTHAEMMERLPATRRNSKMASESIVHTNKTLCGAPCARDEACGQHQCYDTNRAPDPHIGHGCGGIVGKHQRHQRGNPNCE